MSTWTSENGQRAARATGFLAAFLLLSGCLSVGETVAALTQPGTEALPEVTEAQISTRVLRRARMAGGRVIVAPPSGYCIDGDYLRDRGNGFALVAACSTLAGQPLGTVEPAVMTVALAPETSALPDAATLARLFPDAQVINSIDGNGLVLLHLDGPLPDRLAEGADSRHWRGLLSVNGQVLSLGLYAPPGGILAGQPGLVALTTLAEATRAASVGLVPAAPNTAPQTSVDPVAAQPKGGTGLGRLLSRLRAG